MRKARSSGNWDPIRAGLTLFGMDFFNETWRPARLGMPLLEPIDCRDLAYLRRKGGGAVLDVGDNMTEIGLVKTITISYFKAHISEELRKVRKGARIIISDRDNPIAEVVPYRTEPAALGVRPPRTTPFVVTRPTFKIEHDPLEYLLEDREKR